MGSTQVILVRNLSMQESISGIRGIQELSKALAGLEKVIYTGVAMGLDYALRDIVNYIKDNYVWDKYGKGWNDDTAFLRNSLHHLMLSTEGKNILGAVIAVPPYAIFVEKSNEGKHAFLWPGCKEKKADVVEIIKKTIQIGLSEYARRFGG